MTEVETLRAGWPAVVRSRLAALITAAILVPSPSHAVAPYVTDDPEPTEFGHFEIDLAAQYTARSGERSGALPSLEIDYGALPNLELQVIAALAFDRRSSATTRVGAGDTEIGLKYRMIEEDKEGWRPALAVFPQVFLPTGDEGRGLGTGHTHYFLPLWIGKELGDWHAFGGSGYTVDPGAGNRNSWFLGSGVTRKVDNSLTLGGEVFHSTASEAGRKSTTGFNLGAVYDFSDNQHLLVSAGRGLQNATTTNRFTSFVAYQLTF